MRICICTIALSVIGILIYLSCSSADNAAHQDQKTSRKIASVRNKVSPKSFVAPLCLTASTTTESSCAAPKTLQSEKTSSTNSKDVAATEEKRRVERMMFHCPSDQIISSIINAPQDLDTPPLPYGEEINKMFVESLQHKIVIYDDDPENVKVRKQSVIDARQQIVDLMKKGYSVKYILDDFQQCKADDNKMRFEQLNEVRKMKKSGDVDGARLYLEHVNKAFRSIGIKEIDWPLNQGERRALRLEREAAAESGELQTK